MITATCNIPTMLVTLATLLSCVSASAPRAAAVEPGEPMTLGAKPPMIDDKTIVLFDGTSWSGWTTREGQPSAWEVQGDGSVLVRGGDAMTAEHFGDCQIHLEFLCPPMEGAEGQAKSNSGVYLHGRYEVQVLDSFGAEPADNLCGGIYKLHTPLVNAARPAGLWQTYDIVFRSPRLDAAGAVVEKPRITVIHNGIVIHNNVELPSVTGGAIDQSMPATGPLLLQDHGDPVRYRNIWLRKL